MRSIPLLFMLLAFVRSPAGAATVGSTPAPCPTYAAGLVTFGVDQSQPVSVELGQSFILAMRGGGGESVLRPYRMRTIPDRSVVAFIRSFTIPDVAYLNADRGPGQPLLADGPATQYFLFQAQTTVTGTMTITFDEFEVGRQDVPYASKTFTIVVKPATLVC